MLTLFIPNSAFAHGGPPVSIGLMRDNATMYVPVFYWGVWVGQDNGPWKWICEEEINQYRSRKYARGGDGTLIVTDTHGLTVSTDGGCTWTPIVGELAGLRASDIAADPSDGPTLWVTSDQSSNGTDAGTNDNALWVTHDRGSSFARVPGLDGSGRRFESVKLATGGVIYVVSTALTTPFNVTLNHSADNGAHFDANPINFTVDGAAPYTAEVMALDPRDPAGVYLRAFISVPGDGGDPLPLQVLLRSSDGGLSWSEVYRVVGETNPSGATHGIDGVAVDPKRGKIFVATITGLMAGADPGGAATVTLSAIGGLSVTQCVEIQGDAIYVCGNNYPPDLKALARSDDGGQTFQSVLSYQQTIGTIDCPANTPVAQMCPYYWDTYSAQLGINTGIDASTTPDTGNGPGCSCSIAQGGAPPVLFVAGLLALSAYLFLYRRRRRP